MTADPAPGAIPEPELARLKRQAKDHILFYGRELSDTLITKASGARLTDETGREIIDFASGQMCSTLGHGHPAILEAIRAACDDAIHIDSTKLSPPVIELAAELAALLPPNLQKSLFLSTGGESNEAAIRLAKLHTGRFEIASLANSWHGTTAGAQSSTYSSGRRGYGPAMPGSYALPPPYAYRCPVRHCQGRCDMTCLDIGFEMFDQWSTGAGAAVIVEPVQSAGGIVVPPDGWLKKLRALCAARGMLVIYDEAQTGLGRLGLNFGFEHEGVPPDMMTLSKTLGAGVPLSALVTGGAIAQSARERKFSFYTSHANDPMPARVGLAVVRTLVGEQLAARAREMGAYLRAGLDGLAQRYEVLGDVRGRGMLIGLEFVHDRQGKKPNTELVERATKRAFELGLVVNRPGGAAHCWRIAPPLTIDRADIDTAVEIMDRALDECGAR